MIPLVTTINLSYLATDHNLLVTENPIQIPLVNDKVVYDVPDVGVRTFLVTARNFEYGANGSAQTLLITLFAEVVTPDTGLE